MYRWNFNNGSAKKIRGLKRRRRIFVQDLTDTTEEMPDLEECGLGYWHLHIFSEDYLDSKKTPNKVRRDIYHIIPDEDYNTFAYNTGLNIINNFDIEVHYEGTEVQRKYIKKVLREKKDKIYAITNNGGVVVDNEKITLLGGTQTFSKQ